MVPKSRPHLASHALPHPFPNDTAALQWLNGIWRDRTLGGSLIFIFQTNGITLVIQICSLLGICCHDQFPRRLCRKYISQNDIAKYEDETKKLSYMISYLINNTQWFYSSQTIFLNPVIHNLKPPPKNEKSSTWSSLREIDLD